MLFKRAQRTNGFTLFDTIFAQQQRLREEASVFAIAFNVSAFNNAFLALQSANQRQTETCSRLAHRQGCRTATRLRFHHFGARVLDAFSQVSHFLLGEAHAWDLRQQRQDGNARVTADDRHFHFCWLFALQLSNKGVGANNIQRGYAEQFVFVVNTCFLQHFCRDSNGGVHRVSDDTDARFRAHFSNLLHQVFHDARVDVEQV